MYSFDQPIVSYDSVTRLHQLFTVKPDDYCASFFFFSLFDFLFGSILISLLLILFNHPLFSSFFLFFFSLLSSSPCLFSVSSTLGVSTRKQKTHAPHATRRSPQNRRPSRVSIVADLSINQNLQPHTFCDSLLVSARPDFCFHSCLFFLFSGFFLYYIIHLFLFLFPFTPSLYHFPLSCPGGKSVLSGLTLSFSGSTSESPSETGATVEIRIQNLSHLVCFSFASSPL